MLIIIYITTVILGEAVVAVVEVVAESCFD